MNDLDTTGAGARAAFDAAPPSRRAGKRQGALPGQGRPRDRAAEGPGRAAAEPRRRRAAPPSTRPSSASKPRCRRAARRWPRPSSRRSCRPRRWTSRCPAASAAPAACTRSARTIERIEAIFGSMGFDVADGPEIETDWMSFTALNNPGEPPGALDAGHLLRRHEGRRRPLAEPAPAHQPDAGALRAGARARHAAARPRPMPEIRVIAPGRTYRVDSDATHSPMFHQCEGLWIGENVSFKDLKFVFSDFLRQFFETDDLDVRFRPELLPVHRAVGRDRHRLRQRAAGRAAGSRWPAPARCTRTWCATSAWTPSATSASPSAWARTGWRCCATASTTCACSSRTTCASCRSSASATDRAETPFATMQFPESWLREFCNPPLTTAELADLLTMSGLEVEDCARWRRRSAASWWPRSSSCEPHPNADRLRVCKVDAGAHSPDGPLQIVCGAPNARAGLRCRWRWWAPSCRRRRRQALRHRRGQAARRRQPRHAVLGARAEAVRRPRRPARTGGRCAGGAPTCATGCAGRHASSRSSSRPTWRMR
jgi:phenylalanyl-tRNA synthetase alpha chain